MGSEGSPEETMSLHLLGGLASGGARWVCALMPEAMGLQLIQASSARGSHGVRGEGRWEREPQHLATQSGVQEPQHRHQLRAG